MRIGIISDTHNLLRPEVFDAFAGVEHILHAGDVGDPDILHSLGAIAPVTGVQGNTDSWEIASKLPEIAHTTIGEVKVTVVHGHQFGRPTPERLAAAYPTAGLIVFGHTHQPEIERVGETLIVNPGSAGPARFTLPISVAIAEIEDGSLTAWHVRLDVEGSQGVESDTRRRV